MKVKILILSVFFIIMRLNAQVIDEGFESGDFSAYDWILSGDAEWFVSGNYSFEGEYSAQGGNIADSQTTTIEITIDFPFTGILVFAWKVSSEANYDFLRFYLDDEMLSEISGIVAWTQQGYELVAGEHNLRWSYEKDYSVSNGSDIGWLDEIVFYTEEEEFDYDLQVVGMTGANYLIGGESYTFEVTVSNNGIFNVTGYSVSLVDAQGEEYASETVYWMLPPGDERLVELIYEPEASACDTLIGMYAYGYLVTDENPDNDYSEKHDVHIIGAEGQFVSIGSDTTFTSLMPVNFTRHASICESIYFAEEISGTGAVTGIDFFNNFANPVSDIELNIWMGETELETLEEDWIGADSLQLVYSGLYDFPAGENTVNIQFDNLYEYQDGNLVLLVEKAYEEGQHSWQSNFYFSEITGEEAGRTRFSYNDLSNFDPNQLTDGILCDWVANTVFTITPVPYGHLAGYVTGTGAATIPLNSAEITIDDGLWTAVTDSSGYFMIEQIDVGMHEVLISCSGYYPELIEIEILSGELTEIEVTLEQHAENDEDELLPKSLIGKIYPNPFCPMQSRGKVRIEVNLNTDDLPALLNIYDIRGRKIKSQQITNPELVNWDGMIYNRPAATGIYFFKLTTASGREDTKRLLIIK